MITVIEKNTSQRRKDFEELYEEYLRLYYTTEYTVNEINTQLGLKFRQRNSKDIRHRLRVEGHTDAQTRRGLIQRGKWLDKNGVIL